MQYIDDWYEYIVISKFIHDIKHEIKPNQNLNYIYICIIIIIIIKKILSINTIYKI